MSVYYLLAFVPASIHDALLLKAFFNFKEAVFFF